MMKIIKDSTEFGQLAGKIENLLKKYSKDLETDSFLPV